jgi:C4-dicarboxylate transporter, DctQ subunit
VHKIVNNAEEGLLALLLAAMTILTFCQVVLRYVFNAGFVWALEANTYLFGWLILIGISYGVRVHAHIGVDFVVKSLPANVRRVVGLIAISFCLLYAGIMLVGAYNYIYRLWRIGVFAEDLPAPRWLLGIILPIGFLLLGLRLLQQAVAIVRGEAKGFELGDEAAEVLRELGTEHHAAPADDMGRQPR